MITALESTLHNTRTARGARAGNQRAGGAARRARQSDLPAVRQPRGWRGARLGKPTATRCSTRRLHSGDTGANVWHKALEDRAQESRMS